MAVQNPSQVWVGRRTSKTTWTLANGDTGLAQTGARLSDKSVQVTGTFGAGGSVNIEGSNDGGTVWQILRDPQAVALTFTSAGLKQILECPERIRPNCTAGDGTTSININLIEASTA